MSVSDWAALALHSSHLLHPSQDTLDTLLRALQVDRDDTNKCNLLILLQTQATTLIEDLHT